jgi:tubulin beta
VFYHEASGGRYVARAVFFDLEPGMIDAARASPLG